MPRADGTIVLAMDFDGSLVEAHSQPLRWRPRARDFILGAIAGGAKLYLHSCRCTPATILDRELPGDVDAFWRFGQVPADVEYSWGLYEEMRVFLEQEGVWDLLEPWTSPGKPIADLYPDDLGERPDWLALAGELGIALPYADQGGDRALGGPGFVVAVPAGPSPPGGISTASAPAPAAAAGPGVELEPGPRLDRGPGLGA